MLLPCRVLARVIWLRFRPKERAVGDELGYLLWVDEHLYITPRGETGE